MHESVLIEEVLSLLLIKRGGVYIDGTVGSGGHAQAILERIEGDGVLLGIDRDEEALKRSGKRLAKWKKQCVLAHGTFRNMSEIAKNAGIGRVDGVLLDIGVSSEQLMTAERGFSFAAEGPLDMRMDRSEGKTAADLVNALPESDLSDILRRFGEEPNARRIARVMVRERAVSPITTTTRLADIVATAGGYRRGRLHPATRTFQALRICVNDEIESLKDGLAAGLGMLKDGGRLVVISFHSLEDGIAKDFFRRHAGRWESLQAGGRRLVAEEPRVRVLTKKPVTPSEDEIARNPRSRSAKLRAAERIAGDYCSN
jgi:16S rRNA (cytosine1402-N4)-methyltransferase